MASAGRRRRRLPAVVLGLITSCRTSAPAGPARPPEPLPSLSEVDAAHRRGYVQRAQVWRDVPTASLDLLAGPAVRGAFPFASEVACDYVDDEGKLRGLSPKFLCRVGDEDLKVKFGEHNGEVYGEVAATRLFWALGFGADAVYPVRVRCRACPVDPWYWKTRARVPEKTFEIAAIERKLDAVTIESRKSEGWDWRELDTVDPAQGGAPVAHRDALKLLAVLVQHGDNKPDQQRLVCLPGGVRHVPKGDICEKPFLLVSDLGATFGGAGNLSLDRVAKFHFERWSAKPVFKDKAQCIGDLDASMRGQLQYPRIGEAGRKFLAGRLSLLTDGQIRDLFVAARIEGRGETLEENGKRRPVTVDDWAAAFKRKRQEIEEQRCPS
jgi:hypothetical protein